MFCGKHLKISDAFQEKLQKEMPGLNLEAEFKEMDRWLDRSENELDRGNVWFTAQWLAEVWVMKKRGVL
jgi:hypothetical protein